MNKVSRRQFLKVGAATLVVFPVTFSEIGNGKLGRSDTFNSEITYGHIKAADSPRWKAFLNGEDVSSQCAEADDREGWVKLILVDANNRIIYPLITRIVYGKVCLVPWDR